MNEPKPLHAKAHVVTELKAKHSVGPWHEPHGSLQSVHHAPADTPGVIQKALLGASGLQLIRGDIAVCLPLTVLFDLAGQINPRFNEPPDKKMAPAEIEKLAGNGAPH